MPDSALDEFAEDFTHRPIEEFIFAPGLQLQDGRIVIKVYGNVHITGAFFVQAKPINRSATPRIAKLIQDDLSLNVGQDDVLNVRYVGGG